MIGFLTLAMAMMACVGLETTTEINPGSGGGSAPSGGAAIAGAHIVDAFLATDEDGEGRTTVFHDNEIFYLIAEVDGADSMTVSAAWFAVDVELEGFEGEQLIDEVDIEAGNLLDTVTFNLENDDSWPLGEYRVDLSLDGQAIESYSFFVE